MSDEQARREEERLMKSINRQPGARKPTWTPQKQTVNTVTVATTSAPQKVSSGTGETWREKQERLERERKEREANEKKGKEETKKDEPRSRPTSTYGTSSLSVNKSAPPSSSSATTSTSADVAEFEKMISDLDAPKQNEKRSSTVKPNLDELDSLISSFEKKPEPEPEPEPVHTPAPKPAPTPAPAPVQPATSKPSGATELNSTFDELEGLLHSLDKKPSFNSPKAATTTPAPAPVTTPTSFTSVSAATTTSQSPQNADSYKPAPVASSSTSRDMCGRCNQAIQGEKMVAMGMKWHKDHFTCFKCNTPLVDTFVPKDGNPFCENCYQNSMKCTKCDLPISGTHIDAKGKLYHIECAGGEACARCGGAIDKVSVQAADRMWHQDCFKCFNCGSGLVDSYVRKEKEVWCTKCYSSEMMCDKCNQPLPTTYVATKGKKYHSDCFTCGNCSKQLGSNYYDVEGVFQCENCYQNTIGRCATCGNALDGQFVKCLDKKYHENCFVCSGCRTPLEEDFYNVGGNPSCYNCATKA